MAGYLRDLAMQALQPAPALPLTPAWRAPAKDTARAGEGPGAAPHTTDGQAVDPRRDAWSLHLPAIGVASDPMALASDIEPGPGPSTLPPPVPAATRPEASVPTLPSPPLRPALDPPAVTPASARGRRPAPAAGLAMGSPPADPAEPVRESWPPEFLAAPPSDERTAQPPTPTQAAPLVPAAINRRVGRETAGRITAGDTPRAAAETTTEVHIHIGRIEVAASVPAPSAKRGANSGTGNRPMSLDAYLRQRRRTPE